MPKILLASQNQGKLIELSSLLSEVELEILLPQDLILDLEVLESGTTYAENARRKALAYAGASQMVALADDSGLEVTLLGGLPGILSARFAPQPGATDADRRTLLLQQLQGKPRPWEALFRCVIAVATPGGLVGMAGGECYGEIIPHERGGGGFGYDPIFLVAGLDRTMAELSLPEKNRISHRAHATRGIIPFLRELFRNGK